MPQRFFPLSFASPKESFKEKGKLKHAALAPARSRPRLSCAGALQTLRYHVLANEIADYPINCTNTSNLAWMKARQPADEI